MSFAATVLIVALRRECVARPGLDRVQARAARGGGAVAADDRRAPACWWASRLVTQAVYWLAADRHDRPGRPGDRRPADPRIGAHPGRPDRVRPQRYGNADRARRGAVQGLAAGCWRSRASIRWCCWCCRAPSPSPWAPSAWPPCSCCSTMLTSYLLAYGLELIAYSIWDFADARAARHEDPGLHRPAAEVHHHRLHGGARLLRHRPRRGATSPTNCSGWCRAASCARRSPSCVVNSLFDLVA